jgi:sRNA-binding regulator protein Hfq
MTQPSTGLKPGTPIFQRSSKQTPVVRNTPPVTTAPEDPAPIAKPKPPATPTKSDPYLHRMLERGSRLNLYFLNGESLCGVVITEISQYAICVHDRQDVEWCVWKHALSRISKETGQRGVAG